MKYTDEQYVMIEDIKTRKDIARSAKYTKNGSKSKKCSLPSDYLTKKEKEQMNGELITVNLNKPITYDEFKSLSSLLKKEYLEHLLKKYDATMKNIGDMFGVTGRMIQKWCSNLNVHARHSRRFTVEEAKLHAKKWEAFLNGEFDKTVKSDIEIASPSEVMAECSQIFADNFESGMDSVKEAESAINEKLEESNYVSSKDICDALGYGIGSEEIGWLNTNDIYTGATKIDCDFCKELEANHKYSNREQVRRDFHKSLNEYLKVRLDDILECNCEDSETEYIRFSQLFEMYLFNEVRTVRKEK